MKLGFDSRNGTRSSLGAAALCLLSACAAADGGAIDDASQGLARGDSHRGGGPAGRPPQRPGPRCAPASFDDVYEAVADDLSGIDAGDAAFVRYLSVADARTGRNCRKQLATARAAVSKLANSLSIDSRVTAPVAVDREETLYRIDLRDYQWDRPISAGGDGFPDVWEALIAASPYAVPFVGDEAGEAVGATGTRVPVLLSGAFVAVGARDPLYSAALGIPASLDDLFAGHLEIDVDAARADGVPTASFVAETRAGEVEFVAERFEIGARSGFAWQASTVGGGAFDAERELWFSLPNGLAAHVIAGATGAVQSASELTVDTGEPDRRARIANSYMRLRAQGFDLDDPEVAAVMDSDLELVGAALAGLGLDLDDSPEPVSAVFASFQADVDLATAAAELMIDARALSRSLPELDPSLAALRDGTISREAFSAVYLQTSCTLSLVNENGVDPDACL